MRMRYHAIRPIDRINNKSRPAEMPRKRDSLSEDKAVAELARLIFREWFIIQAMRGYLMLAGVDISWGLVFWIVIASGFLRFFLPVLLDFLRKEMVR